MDSTSQSNTSNWSCSQGSHTKGDLLQIQEMKMQNDHLRQIVNQLQGTIETQNEQLAQALETASAVSSLHEENTSLKLKLQDVTDSGNRAKRALKAQLIELTNKSEEDKIKMNTQAESQAREIAQQKKINQEVTKERNLLAEELDETKAQLNASVEKGAKLAKQNAKGKEKSKKLLEQLGDLTEKYTQLNTAQEQLALENKDQSEKITALQEEIESLKALNEQANNSLKSKTEECGNLEKAIAALQDELKEQKDDFVAMSEEREKLLELVQKMQITTSQYEDQLETLKTENAALATKAKKATSLTAQLFTDNFDFQSIQFPFEEDLKARIMKIVSFDHFQSPQKVQLIINECAKDINTLRSDCEEAKESEAKKTEELENIRKSYSKAHDIINSVLREWKNLECNEQKIDVIAFCDQDEAFLNFLAEQCVKLENLSEAAEFLGPMFVAAELFSDDAAEQRKAIIDSVAQNNKDLATLISAMFLVNGRLKKQLATVLNGKADKAEIENAVHQLGVESINVVPSLIESYQEKINHLKETRREVHKALVAARDAISEKEKEETTLHQQITSLQKRVNELQQENAQLKGEIEETKTCFFNQQQQIQQQFEQEKKQKEERPKKNARKVQTADSSANTSTISSQASIASIASNESELSTAIKGMQRSIQEKTLENETLKQQIEQIQEEAEEARVQQKKESQKVEQELRTQVRDLEDALKATADKLAKTRRKAKNVVKDLKSQHESELNTVANNFESAKAEINECLTDTKDKAEKANAVIKQLQETVSHYESENKDIREENARLNQSLKCLEMKITNLQEQYAREQKAAQAAQSVKMLNIETQHQKEQKEAKIKAEQEKQKAIDFFTQHLGSLYHIVDLDYDESALTHLFGRLQSDLGKLKFFQEQATKL